MSEENQEVETTEEDGFEVTLETEAPEQEEQVEAKADDGELEDYSSRVQKRIRDLNEKYRREERDREEAVRIAQTFREENEKLKARLKNLDMGYLNEYGSRLDSQLATAKQAYREAHESGDVDRMFEAQEALSKISIEQERYRLAKQRQERSEVEEKAPQQEAVQQAPVRNEPPKIDKKAEAWASKNEWFGNDDVMTAASFVIHNKLVDVEGFDPTSDEYYNEIDRRIREQFPHKFDTKKSSGSPRVASAETSASRSNKTGRRTVKLTPSQIAIAKKLNVPLEEYAKYVKD